MAKIVKRSASKSAARGRRHLRLRKKVTGTAVRPRLVVSRSSRHVFVQVVDDTVGKTVASASTMEADLRTFDGDKSAKARKVGELVAERRLVIDYVPGHSEAEGAFVLPPESEALERQVAVEGYIAP